ncbi:hypothetical protein ACOMHN_025073 [Nucella lapillus]
MTIRRQPLFSQRGRRINSYASAVFPFLCGAFCLAKCHGRRLHKKHWGKAHELQSPSLGSPEISRRARQLKRASVSLAIVPFNALIFLQGISVASHCAI